MLLKVWFLLLFIMTSSSGSNDEEIEKIKDDEPNKNPVIPEHLFICLKVVSREKFNGVINRFKKVIADVATSYCRETLVVMVEDLKEENVLFDDIGTCSNEKCVTGSLQIKIRLHPYSLNEIHLKEIWNKAKISPLLKELGIEECKEPSSYKVLIITLIIIIVLLGIVLAVLIFLTWDKILSCLSCSKGRSESNRATEDNSWTYQNNDIYDSAYIQPPGYTASYNDQPYLEPVQKAKPQYITVLSETAGKDNKGYQPDSGFNSVQRSGNTMSAKVNEESDEFDSGEEFSYPSPLKAPPVPPRNESSGESRSSASISSQSTLNTTVGTSVHYLSSPIQP